EAPVLVRGDRRLDAAAAHGDVAEDGGAHVVVLAQVVVNDLEVPDALAGLRVEGDERVRVQVRARPPSTVLRGGGRRQRNVHVAELFVCRHRIPRADVTRHLPRFVAPRVGTGLAGLRHDVKGPQQLARLRVEAAHVLRRRFLRYAAIARSRAVAGDADDVA